MKIEDFIKLKCIYFFENHYIVELYITYRSEENDLKKSQEEQVEVNTTNEPQVDNHALIFLLALKTNNIFFCLKSNVVT